jgi:hypothetical protein
MAGKPMGIRWWCPRNQPDAGKPGQAEGFNFIGLIFTSRCITFVIDLLSFILRRPLDVRFIALNRSGNARSCSRNGIATAGFR